MGLQMSARARAAVTVQNDKIEVTLVETDPRSLAFFAAHGVDEHAVLAEEAWRIGIRALASAFAQAEEVRLKDVGLELVQNVEAQLRAHLEQQEKRVSQVLKQYFSPEDGQLTQRMKAFVRDDGELAGVLKQYLAPDRSVLAETLAQRIGETSPLFKMLSPTESEGLVQQMQKRFDQALAEHAKSVADALDPHADGTPVQRFLAKLKAELREAGDDQEKMLKALTAAIDPTNDDSLINKLRRDVEKANTTLLAAINPDTEGSPMATIKGTLTTLIEKHMEANKELLEKAEERQQRFEKEVKESLARIEQRKKEAERTTHGGLEYEDLVVAYTERLLSAGPYILEATGNTVGHLTSSKKGDQVIRFGPEHAFAGCGLVVEAKRQHGYTVARALDELEEAKKNRACGTGLFVMAARHRPKNFPRFARYGSNVLVVWDEEDPATNPYLEAGVLTGLALATRTRTTGEAGDINALHDVEKRVAVEIDRLEKMHGYVGNIRRDADKIADEIRKGKDKLDLLIRKAADVLTALNVQADDEREAQASPILVDEEGLEQARAAFGADGTDGAGRAAVQGEVAVGARRVRGEADDEEQ